jgi:hypothetical protein
MTIGILTYHDGANHGAYLQAWATWKTLSNAGFDTEIIHYKNRKHHAAERPWNLEKLKHPFYSLRLNQKKKAFKQAHKKFKLGAFTTNPQAVRAKEYDAVVIGSDVVWNYKIFGYDPLFFGRLNAKRVISFSASFGSVRPQDRHPPEIADDLKNFDALSVRDQNSLELVQQLTGRQAEKTVDPTLIYDFSPDLPGAVSPKQKPYILVYSYLHPMAAIEQVRAYAAGHQVPEVLCVGYPPPLRGPRYCTQTDMNVDPFGWIQLFRHAEAILTCTFHGVVFSLKSRKPFFYVSNDQAHNRVASLLEQCKISHTLELGKENQVSFFDPDYENVMPLLEREAAHAKNWLLQQVQSETDEKNID